MNDCIICEYCKTIFKSISAKKLHQKKAKYCLKIQNEDSEEIIINNNFKCDLCDKILSSKQKLNKHYILCCNNLSNLKMLILKYKNNIKDLEVQLYHQNIQINEYKINIKNLHNTIENITIKAIEKPTTTTNNNEKATSTFVTTTTTCISTISLSVVFRFRTFTVRFLFHNNL
jgi:hypothetical protein